MRSRSQVVDFFDATSRAFDQGYASDANFEERFALWMSLIARYATPQGTVLDVGCGPGHLACFAASLGCTTTAIDPSQRMLELATRQKTERGLSNMTLREGTLEILRRESVRADLVLCSSVLEYLPNLDDALSILAAATNRNGRLIVSLPNAACWYRRVETLAYALVRRPAYRRFVANVLRPERFAQHCRRQGLRVVETRYCATHHALRAVSPVLPERARGALFVMVLEHADLR